MKIYVYAENGTTYQVYSLAKAYLSTGKQVGVSSNEGANTGANAVDGNDATRWAASSGSYPQHIIIDLGGVFNLDDIDISWYVSGTRYYRYNIYVGSTENDFSLVVNRTNNNTSGKVSDSLNGTRGRYIKVEVTGVSDGSGYASIYEIVVNGWGINSSIYEVNENTKTVKVNSSTSEISQDEFLKNLKCEGNYQLEFANGNGNVKNGDTFLITDSNNNTHAYTIVIE